MIISFIVAMDRQGVIGVNGQLPWRLSNDLKHFKAVTMGKPLIMGRKTHESIGRPLPGRENIVITRQKDYTAAGCAVFNAIETALEYCSGHEEIMVMGGAGLYEQLFSRAARIYLTRVDATVSGDTYFPEFDETGWSEVERQDHQADENNEYPHSFSVLERNYRGRPATP